MDIADAKQAKYQQETISTYYMNTPAPARDAMIVEAI